MTSMERPLLYADFLLYLSYFAATYQVAAANRGAETREMVLLFGLLLSCLLVHGLAVWRATRHLQPRRLATYGFRLVLLLATPIGVMVYLAVQRRQPDNRLWQRSPLGRG